MENQISQKRFSDFCIFSQTFEKLWKMMKISQIMINFRSPIKVEWAGHQQMLEQNVTRKFVKKTWNWIRNLRKSFFFLLKKPLFLSTSLNWMVKSSKWKFKNTQNKKRNKHHNNLNNTNTNYNTRTTYIGLFLFFIYQTLFTVSDQQVFFHNTWTVTRRQPHMEPLHITGLDCW